MELNHLRNLYSSRIKGECNINETEPDEKEEESDIPSAEPEPILPELLNLVNYLKVKLRNRKER